VLGPWVNRPWLNAIAVVIISVLLMLSGILTVTTLFPSIDVAVLTSAFGAVLVVTLAALGVLWWRRRPPGEDMSVLHRRRRTWTMQPLALLERPAWSPMRRSAMLALRGYLVIAILLLVVKTVQIATGHA
jgi:amino acid transporter